MELEEKHKYGNYLMLLALFLACGDSGASVCGTASTLRYLSAGRAFVLHLAANNVPLELLQTCLPTRTLPYF